MRLMADRVGSAGRGLGIDVDAPLGADALARFDGDVERFADRTMQWPLLIGAWKRKG
jgi:hypothetical protein